MANYKYVAFGFTKGRIEVSEPCRSIVDAALGFFKDNPAADHCSIRRVFVSFTGTTFNDAEFKIRQISRKNLLDKLKEV